MNVSVGSWNARALTDNMGSEARNFWKDSCLPSSSEGGYLDIYQVHSYAYMGIYDSYSPFRHQYSDYGLDKPLIVGEFSQISGAGLTSAQQYTYLFCNHYAGAWGWQANGSGEGSDTFDVLKSGMASLRQISRCP